jgi:hypothetical protein
MLTPLSQVAEQGTDRTEKAIPEPLVDRWLSAADSSGDSAKPPTLAFQPRNASGQVTSAGNLQGQVTSAIDNFGY